MKIETVLRALLFRLREGCRWRALKIFGKWSTIYGHWRRWVKSGIWEKVLNELTLRARGKLWSIDSTSCKVHKHGHGAPQGPEREEIGKSKGGPNTKIHAIADAKGRIVDLFLSPGHRSDSLYGEALCDGLPEGITVLADKAYDKDELIAFLEDQGLGHCIPSKKNRKVKRPLDKRKYRLRHRIENAFQRLKEYRAVATRYEKLGENFLGFATLAAILAWI